MTYYFITGVSRGLGKALAKAALAQKNSTVYGMGRSHALNAPNFKFVSIDFSDSEKASEFAFPKFDDADKLVLINNAGTLLPSGYGGKQDNKDIAMAFQVNTVSPSILANNFLSSYAQSKAQKIIINISSGAAQRALDGWSVYCASKAALDMHSTTLALENKDRADVHIFSIAPGKVDTDMQAQIRQLPDGAFSQRDAFREVHKAGQLSAPDEVAHKYMQVVEHPENYSKTIFRITEI